MDEGDVGAGGAGSERHPQRIEDEVGAHVGGELPADDLAREGVDDEGEEARAFPRSKVRVGVGPGRGVGLSAGPAPRPALRTGHARLASGSPRIHAALAHGVAMRAAR